MNIGKGIRIVRAARGMTQKELANQAKLNSNYISMIESKNPTRTPSLEAIYSIAEVLQVPVYILVLLSSSTEDLEKSPSEHVQKLAKELLENLIK